MTYAVIIPKPVQKQIKSLPKTVAKRIALRLKELADEPRPQGAIKMKGSKNDYRIRIGDYRVCYAIKDTELVVLVLRCDHRKNVYRKK
ncbi:MAG: type II toxin-antitoxin system RelE/ParE family toxin [Merismopedia sp. SIO2A8]|nr:type II toxin-antitoxin system RelE/ParE family toxin [Merismopedia sp. SIO2A8]